MIVQKLTANLTYACCSILIFSMVSCGSSQEKTSAVYRAKIKELTDQDYPDNPDKSIEHSLAGSFSHSEVVVEEYGMNFSLVFLPNNKESDTLILKDINLLEFIPTVPNYVRGNDYLTEITLINQEWNRQQVKFGLGEFIFTGSNQESKQTKRVDLARNCLDSYLWEVITYAEQDSGLAPVYHGWFDFPHALYQELFKIRNNLNFSDYASSLENWKDPVSQNVDFTALRAVQTDTIVSFVSMNQ